MLDSPIQYFKTKLVFIKQLFTLSTSAASTKDCTSSIMSSTMMAILPPTSPTTLMGGFSLAVRGGRVAPTVVTLGGKKRCSWDGK